MFSDDSRDSLSTCYNDYEIDCQETVYENAGTSEEYAYWTMIHAAYDEA